MENSTPQAKSQPSKASSASQPINENHINVSFPIQQFQQEKQGGVKAITIEPQPIKIYVDTPIDYPSIFVGTSGVMVALAVGLMGYLGQRSQVRASRANFRHDWQQEFKQFAGRLVSVSARMKHELDKNVEYVNTDEFKQLFFELMESKARIKIMLDRSKSYSDDFMSILDDVTDAVLGKDKDKFNPSVRKFVRISNEIVEKAWQDMRSDLEGNGFRWWKSIFS